MQSELVPNVSGCLRLLSFFVYVVQSWSGFQTVILFFGSCFVDHVCWYRVGTEENSGKDARVV